MSREYKEEAAEGTVELVSWDQTEQIFDHRDYDFLNYFTLTYIWGLFDLWI